MRLHTQAQRLLAAGGGVQLAAHLRSLIQRACPAVADLEAAVCF